MNKLCVKYINSMRYGYFGTPKNDTMLSYATNDLVTFLRQGYMYSDFKAKKMAYELQNASNYILF